ncbi:uncharacterized protein LOC117504004 [Thalassophryne amazonica]|uniref:uncharacterized protein LOC117504004 n=1 Tax=Thalassophryne amazonica TaxID=390379 RepID=UPI0014726A2F|nr:uncharacterized protein LOC117504004 [Thalassophryne amazonica]
MGARENPALLTFCQALDSLTHSQLQQMWSNACYVIEALAFLVFRRSSDCSVEDTTRPPADIPFSQTFPLPDLQPHRVARRDTLNLNELVCNYNSWLEDNVVDVVHVSLCSDNKREEFVTHVCNNALLMEKLLLDKANSWLWNYCASYSAGRQSMSSQLCHYDQWLAQYIVPNSSLLAFCLSVDGHALKSRICGSIVFFSLVFSNINNMALMPNCSDIPPPSGPNKTVSVSESCQYSQWHDVTLISIDDLSLCIQLDPVNFAKEVCANKTLLTKLIQNEANAWLQQHCSTISMPFEPTEPPFIFSISEWCDYHTWAGRLVDTSVIGLCWQNDKAAFEKNICCNETLLEKLLQDSQNEWLESVCAGKDTEVDHQVCNYSEWNQPIVIDMADLALCSEIDPLNFTSKVCSNATILQNLLVNLDNTWLLQHCANYSTTGVSFRPAEQCQYSSWSTNLPNTTLLALCWDYDQANFVSSVCPNAGLLSLLAEKQATMWVRTLCNIYGNYNTANNATTNSTTNNTTTEPYFCVVANLVKRLNWTCSADFTSACQPGTSQDMAVQMILRCWLEVLTSRVEDLLTPPVAAVLEQAVSATVVILLNVEEVQNISFHVTENIRLSLLRSVVKYLDKETNIEKKRVLLQCFGRVLTSMMHTARDITTDEYVIIKEYFRLPLAILRPVLSMSHVTTVRLILQYYSRNKDRLQLSDEYLSTMVSVVLQTHVVKDGSLLSELDELLVAASPADIRALPPLQTNANVRETINRNLQHMSPDQQWAFGWWYSNALDGDDIVRGHLSLIRDTGNLIAYLPFYNFQHLSAGQVTAP